MTLCEYLNSQFTLVQNLDFLLRILAACFCGACIGFERTKRFKEAGIRTHIIVCCAASLIMIVSKYGFADLTNAGGGVFNGTRGADPARIAAQVVSGISFLGAGVIFKNGSAVKGLTTAAGIWATAGIGLALGAGPGPAGQLALLLLELEGLLRLGADVLGLGELALHQPLHPLGADPSFLGVRGREGRAEPERAVVSLEEGVDLGVPRLRAEDDLAGLIPSLVLSLEETHPEGRVEQDRELCCRDGHGQRLLFRVILTGNGRPKEEGY